ncbi:MAG: PAS domain-containing protein [Phycisphaerales bacterium]|nr:PAS domain-containing protein [Phycisphaerales bacterium]
MLFGAIAIAAVISTIDLHFFHAWAVQPTLAKAAALLLLLGTAGLVAQWIRANDSRLRERSGELEQLAGFFESSPEPICIVDADGLIVRANEAWELLRTGDVPAVGLPLFEFVNTDDREALGNAFERARTGEDTVAHRARSVTRDGEQRSLEWRFSQTGALCFVAARDLTERLSIEQELFEQAERTELTLLGGGIGMWDWEIPTGELIVDSRWAGMIGETPESLGRDLEAWSSHVHPEDLPIALERVRQHFEEGVPYREVQFRMRHRDGSWKWIQASGKVVSWDAKGEPVRMVGIHIDVTERMNRKLEHDRATQRTELALQAGRMGLWEWNMDTGAFRCDPRWAQTLGERHDDLLPDAATLLSRIHEDDVERLEDALERHRQGLDQHIVVQCRMRHRNGDWRWMRLYATFVADSTPGEGGQLVGIQMDVHDEVLAEREIARREALLASTSQMTGIGGWEFDIHTEELYWSEQVRAIHEVADNYEPNVAEAIDFYHPDDRAMIAQGVQRAIEERERFDVEARFVTRTGRQRWVRSVGGPVMVDGEVARLVGAFQDITQQREQRDALEESNRALESAQSIARMGSWSVDYRTDEVTWSKQLFEIFDHPIEAGPPDYDTVLSHYLEEDARWLADSIQKARMHGTPYALVLERANTENGIRYVAIDGRTRIDDSGEVFGLYGTARDVTAEVEREAELREAQAKAEDANQSKTEFLANMSHEIRTPMTSIIGFADLLAEPDLTGDQRADYISTIRRNGEHLLSIINDILDISKIEAGQMVTERIRVNPRELLESAVRLMSVQAEAKGLDIKSTCATGVPEIIETDPTRLRQILVNLMGNAIKFTENGSVRVAADYREGAAGRGVLAVEIVDTGIGMSQEQSEHVFEAFTQADASTSRRFGGTGLGLRISKRLAGLLGGDISFESTQGVGTTFYVTIDTGAFVKPIPSGNAVASSAGRVQPSDTLRLDGVRILLMEDGVDNIRLIKTHLERVGAVVTCALDGREGLKMLTADGRLKAPLEFDVILSDMQMPEIDGYTVVQTLRQAGCELPIIALTAHSTDEDRVRCFGVGCDSYATKPIGRERLVATIVEAMSRRQAA